MEKQIKLFTTDGELIVSQNIAFESGVIRSQVEDIGGQEADLSNTITFNGLKGPYDMSINVDDLDNIMRYVAAYIASGRQTSYSGPPENPWPQPKFLDYEKEYIDSLQLNGKITYLDKLLPLSDYLDIQPLFNLLIRVYAYALKQTLRNPSVETEFRKKQPIFPSSK